MILERTEAVEFILGYQAILHKLAGRSDSASRLEFLAGLMDGRRELAEQPGAIEVGLEKLGVRGTRIDSRVERAIRATDKEMPLEE